MKVTPLELSGLKLVELDVFGDKRGFFVERYNQTRFKEFELPTHYVQDNHSRSAPGVLRGLHYQTAPTQGKLVGAARGRIWDVAVDIRPQSSTYGKYYTTELNDENGKLLWIPPGFAHGFCVLGHEPADVIYKVDALYHPQSEGGILWNDADLKIHWPLENPTISAKDEKLPTFKAYQQSPPQCF